MTTPWSNPPTTKARKPRAKKFGPKNKRIRKRRVRTEAEIQAAEAARAKRNASTQERQAARAKERADNWAVRSDTLYDNCVAKYGVRGGHRAGGRKKPKPSARGKRYCERSGGNAAGRKVRHKWGYVADYARMAGG